MKVSEAARHPQLEFLTHRSNCLSETSRGEFEDFFLFLSKQGQNTTFKKTPKSAKQEVIVFCQVKYGHRERRKRPFDHAKRKLSKTTFILLWCYFSTTVSPAFLEREEIVTIIAKELKLNKQNTNQLLKNWTSVNFLFDPLNFQREKNRGKKSSQLKLSWGQTFSAVKMQRAF